MYGETQADKWLASRYRQEDLPVNWPDIVAAYAASPDRALQQAIVRINDKGCGELLRGFNRIARSIDMGRAYLTGVTFGTDYYLTQRGGRDLSGRSFAEMLDFPEGELRFRTEEIVKVYSRDDLLDKLKRKAPLSLADSAREIQEQFGKDRAARLFLTGTVHSNAVFGQ